MKALDILVDWLAEQKESEQVYIVKELLKNLSTFNHRDLIFEEVESFDPFSMEELKGYIEQMLLEEMTEKERVVQTSESL